MNHLPSPTTRRITCSARPPPTLHRDRYRMLMLTHTGFGVSVRVSESVADRDTRDSDHEHQDEDGHESADEVVHVSLFCSLFFVVY